MIRAGLFLALFAALPALAAPDAGLPSQASATARSSTGAVVGIGGVTLTPNGDGTYGFAVVLGLNTTKKAEAVPLETRLVGGPSVVVVADGTKELTFDEGLLKRRGSVGVVTGDAPKGVIARLTLVDAKGGTVWSGSARLGGGVLWGRWDGKYADGTQPTFAVEGAQLHPTGTKGAFDLSFALVGDGALTITGGNLQIQDSSTFKVVDDTSFSASGMITTRTFTTDVRFDGDPVGSLYGLDITVTDGSGTTTVESGVLSVSEGEPKGSMPGPVLSVYQGGYGNGYMPPAGQGQTQQTQLL